MVKFENVTFRYTDDGPDVLHNVTVEVRPGEAVAVMGANGSGKTTFVRLIAGLLESSRGRVVLGEGAGEAPGVGILFQNPDNQLVAVTVEKEVAFALENMAVPLEEMEKQITATLRQFDIEHLRRRLTAELSGGEKQRVALASVMVARPKILLLDEPDSFLDQAGKAALTAVLAELRERMPDMVQIHITQYPQTARGYDRMIVFERGEIAADAPPESVFADREFCMRTALAFEPPVTSGVVRYEDQTGGSQVAMVQASEVTFGYREQAKVLQALSIRVKAGEIVAVVGPSGAGKSTLGLLLTGLLEPTGGEIAVLREDGRVISREATAGKISAILQQPERQFFLPTCAEEIAFGPENLGRPVTPEQVSEMFEQVGLDSVRFAERDPFRLSGGEKRRLAFAAVLSMQPDIVIFDEPTCALDQEGVGRFIQLASELRSRGAGLVVISHDGDIVRALADRVLLLLPDRRCLIRTADEFFDDPELSRFVSAPGWSVKNS